MLHAASTLLEYNSEPRATEANAGPEILPQVPVYFGGYKMRMIVHVKLPNDPFNAYVKDGSAGKKIQRILEANKPEAVYFTETDGRRGAIMIVDLADASKIPMLVEPWFLTFNATCEFHIAMTPEDLGKSESTRLGTSGRSMVVRNWRERGAALTP